MQVVSQVPHPALTPYVRCYWEWWHEVPLGETHQFPYGCTGRTHWVIFLDDSFRAQTTLDGGGQLANYGSMLMGQMLRPYTHHLTTTARVLVVDFTAAGFHQLWSLPAQQLTGQTIEAELVMGAATRNLVDRLRNAPSSTARFGMLDAYLRHRITHRNAMTTRTEAAIERIQQRPGQIQVRSLAQWLNCPERTFTRRFTEMVGLSPKSYARVQRFLQTRHYLEKQSANDWRNIPEALGYYDQAHLINEFRYFTGKSPLLYGADYKPLLDRLRES